MRHLTTAQLVDLADGVEVDSSALHLRSCPACRRQLDDLRATMSDVAELEAREPSPLFWDHFSARVHNAVQVEPRTGSWASTGVRTAGSRLAAWLGMRPATAGVFALLAVAVVLLFQVSRPIPLPNPSGVTSDVGGLSREVPLGDDPSLSLVADLAVDLDWETAREAGLTTQAGVDDEALGALTPDERRELRQLLQRELSSSRPGA